ncbi:serine/threonine-protein kinase NLK-like protein [Sarcoptes scabiei]|uniref:Mitogen-activated protein kinase n=1 Tax=Sarcoptes scabiei TaxID=52283 RepID=A0A132AMY4_SARSC|nr:serine/threonine-protein kinase NLK-like protein [Sarcoptes scabiei]
MLSTAAQPFYSGPPQPSTTAATLLGSNAQTIITKPSSNQLLVHHPDYPNNHHTNSTHYSSNNPYGSTISAILVNSNNNNHDHHVVGYYLNDSNLNAINNNHKMVNNHHNTNLINNNHIVEPSSQSIRYFHNGSNSLNHSSNHNNNNNNRFHHQQQENQTNSENITNSSSNTKLANNAELTPDRPIGYGAFGVVWSVTDPRDGKRVALKKMPNVFQNLISSKRVFREIKMLSFFKHENVLSALDILQPPVLNYFQEIYVITELMESDLHKIIVSSQPLTPDHIKVFLYQMLRGLKYLHSAKILHRDIKPGNLLVNSNCLLKICDFGLARVEENDRSRRMTQEVVTQYYRAPELLMGAKYYNESIDMWSVGCIFAELLGRRILFQAQTPIQQLELITDLLGTPSNEDMRYGCEAAKQHVRREPFKSNRLSTLIKLSNHATNEAIHLLCQMLTFNPDKRIDCATALDHSYLIDGRARYHACMCRCCPNINDNNSVGGNRKFCSDPEPISPIPFNNSFEKELTSVQIVKERLYKEIMQRCMSSNRAPLCINPLSASFKNFASAI